MSLHNQLHHSRDTTDFLLSLEGTKCCPVDGQGMINYDRHNHLLTIFHVIIGIVQARLSQSLKTYRVSTMAKRKNSSGRRSESKAKRFRADASPVTIRNPEPAILTLSAARAENVCKHSEYLDEVFHLAQNSATEVAAADHPLEVVLEEKDVNLAAQFILVLAQLRDDDAAIL
jgi:hypothetical protein